MIVLVTSLLMLLADARTSTNDHVFGINGCEATEMPRVQIDEPVSEFFYSLQIDDIPGFEYNAAENTVKLPMGQLLKGWYYHEASVFDLVDAGVVEWYFFPNPVSLFTHANWGAAENLMTVMKEGTIDLARQEDMQKMAAEKKAKQARGEDKPYVWENADRERRKKVNQHALMTMAQLQFADLSFDQLQTDQVIASPASVPDFAPIQKKLKDAVVDVDFPLSPGEHEDLKVATNCLHGESPEYNDEYLIIELEKERVYHKGQTLFPLKTWTNVAGRSWWKIDEEMGTLDLYYEGFQMGYLDAKEPERVLKYFQSPPHMDDDNRVNGEPAPGGNAKLQPGCGYVSQIREMEEDTHMFWEPLEKVCTPEMLDTFKETILTADFNSLVTNQNDVAKGLKLITAATDYIMCGNNYLRSYIKYSHGYDFLEAGAFIHYLMEFYPPFTVPFLTNPDLNQFSVDYIYGKEAPAAANVCKAKTSQVTDAWCQGGNCYDGAGTLAPACDPASGQSQLCDCSGTDSQAMKTKSFGQGRRPNCGGFACFKSVKQVNIYTPETYNKMVDIMSESTGYPKASIQPTTAVDEICYSDELDKIEMIGDVEDGFGIDLQEDDLVVVYDVQDMANLVQIQLNGAENAVAGGVRAEPPKRAYGHKSESSVEEAVGNRCRLEGKESGWCDRNAYHEDPDTCDTCKRGSRFSGLGVFGSHWCCTEQDVRDHGDCECYQKGYYNRWAEEEITMVHSDSGSYIVNGFAFTGFMMMMYGAYAHYFGRKSGDHTKLEMA